MERIKLSLAICLLVFLSVSCSSISNPTFGPVQEEKFSSLFSETIGENQKEIIFYSRAIWYPNKNGFKFLPAGKKSRKGVIVYTTRGIYFSEWNGKQYSIAFNAEYDQINELRLVANELLGRIVFKKDLYNSFEILGVNGPELPDKDETEVAHQIIASQKQS